ncbi:MAG: hypothetical protein CMK59_07390 [Proteobacteria bacterium]|nr:hypothetical protein [Pseudomonadota bacterium]
MFFLFMYSCFSSQTHQQLKATVNDTWGNKITHATISIPTYNMSIPIENGIGWLDERHLYSRGYKEILFEASALGFITANKILEHDYQSPFGASLSFELFPRIENSGVYGIGKSNYKRLLSAPVFSLSNDLETINGFHYEHSVGLKQPVLLSKMNKVISSKLYELTNTQALQHKERSRLSAFKPNLLVKKREMLLQSSELKQPQVLLHTLPDFQDNSFYLFEQHLQNGSTIRYLFHKIKPPQ